MVFLPIFFYAVYFVFVGFLILGWNRAIGKNPRRRESTRELVSVIIPARNEGRNIANLLRDVEKQDYDNYEVIVIDDHSDDNTADVIRTFLKNNSRFRLLTNTGSGKKAALTLGVQEAQGTIIVTTDADCRVSSGWIASLACCFSDENVQMVIGQVKMEGGSFFSGLQSLEFASLIGSSTAMASWQYPVMCNGANLAFRKKVFNEVEGYRDNLHIPSGDDEFLMRKVLKAYPGGIQPATNKEAVVTTLPNSTLNQLFQQRIRWAGKSTVRHSLLSTSLAIFIFGFQLVTISLPLFLALDWIDFRTFILLLAGKASLELLFLYNVCRFLDLKWSWAEFAVLQVIYPFYVVAVALLSRSKSFEWKGRKLKSLSPGNILNKEILG